MLRLEQRCDAMGVALARSHAATLVGLLERMLRQPQNLTAIATLVEAIDRHAADSLSALALPEVGDAGAIVDVGSGGGFPGLALAVVLPDVPVTLVESERRKAEWLREASASLPNVRVVGERAETLAGTERERWSLATARALAPAPVALELLAPLVRVGGAALLWAGPRDPEVEARIDSACGQLGFSPPRVSAVPPFPGAGRHLHLCAKVAPTPERFPRRPGVAAHRPIA